MNIKKTGFTRIAVFISLGVVFTGLVVLGCFQLRKLLTSAGEKNGLSQSPYVYDITPLSFDSTGVEIDSGFKIVSKGASLSELHIQNTLTVTPGEKFEVKKISASEFLINFLNPLKPNTVYAFSVNDQVNNFKKSWAFQTKQDFRVVRTLPRDKSTSVPLNSGIEITFTHENIRAMEGFFEISPAVEGRFEYHKNTAVFVPKSLEPNKIYTVTVKKGLGISDSQQTLAEDYVFSFQTLNPDVKETSPVSFLFSDNLYNVSYSQEPVLEVYADESMREKEFEVEVYKYSSDEAFIANMKKLDSYPWWAYIDKSSVEFDMSNLEKVLQFNTKLTSSGSKYWFSTYICLPEKLPEGHYLVKASTGDLVSRTHIQVSDIAAYITVGKDKTLAWINSTSTGSAIEGAAVEVEPLKPVTTDSRGIAEIHEPIPEPALGSHYYFKVSRGKKPVFLALVPVYRLEQYFGSSLYFNNNDIRNSYWTYAYLDRGVYLPGDTVRIWGLIKPRGDEALPASGRLRISRYGENPWKSDVYDVIDSKEVNISRTGTYRASFTLPNLNQGWYYIQLLFGDRIVTETVFEVRQYVKPAYRVQLSPEKDYYFSWEDINLGIQASFFEGSPVPGISLDYSYFLGELFKEGSVTCDDNGYGQVAISPGVNVKSWRPLSLYFRMTNSHAEEEEISSNVSLPVFPSDTMIEIEHSAADGKVMVDVRTSLIDLSRISGEGNPYNPDEYRGQPVEKRLKVRVYEKYWEKRVVGDYYDFINKKTVEEYEYYPVQKLHREFSVGTSGGVAKLEFPAENDKTYLVEVSCVDGKGSEITEESTIYTSDYIFYNQNTRIFTTETIAKKYSFTVGEPVSVGLFCNGKPVEEKAGEKVLFMIFKNGLLDYYISEKPKYTFTFETRHIPNAFVQAVYFDGGSIQNASLQEVRLDYSDRRLNIDVKADKAEYKPGDTVNLDIKVTDSQGKPCMAEVNISVVDEAFFKIREQYVDTLASIYGYSVASGVLTEYNSSAPGSRVPGGAEMGGEGGGEIAVRSEFKDTAFFTSVTTAEDGTAKASFKLPDNVTSWRMTYQAVTGDLKAGSGRTTLNASLPFFIDTIFNDVFMAGDTPSITIRAMGSRIKGFESVEYSLLLEGPDVRKTYRARQTASNFCKVSLESLKEGNYSITVVGKAAGYSDAIKREFRVLENILEVPRTSYYTLEEDLKFGAVDKSPVTLVFYNEEVSDLYRALGGLRYAWGERVDQRLSRLKAAEFLKAYFEEEDPLYFNRVDDLKNYQLSDGGIALFPYDSSSPELSAKVCSLALDSFDRLALKSYFYDIINTHDSLPSDVAASYWGLAVFREPVLIEIKNLLKENTLGLKDRIYLGIALAELGDLDGARAVYDEITEKHLKRAKPYAYIEDHGFDRDKILEVTSLCSILAMKTDAPEKHSLYSYVMHNSGVDLITNLEQLMYIAHNAPAVNKVSSFSYRLGGSEVSVTLNGSRTYRLVLTGKDLNSIRFGSIKGNIKVALKYMGPVEDLMKDGSNLVSIKRVYTANNVAKTEFDQSDLVRVALIISFSEAAPDGFYNITDVLPAGFKYVSSRPRPSGERVWYPDETGGQRVSFGIYYSRNNPSKPEPIIYYARAISPGTFTADTAVIKHYGTDAAGFSGRATVGIK